MTDFEQKELVVDIAARLARILLSSESVPESGPPAARMRSLGVY